MIYAILNGNQGLITTLISSSLIAALLFFFLGRRLRKPGMSYALAGISLAVEMTATLYPISPNAPASATCFIERNIITGTFTTQGLLNVLLFVPLAASATWLTRRPVPAALACVALSAATEVAQALTPGMGRSCDSTDLWTNSVGTLIGTLAGTAALRWNASRRRSAATFLISERQIRRSLIGFSAGMTAIGLTAAFTVTFVMTEVAWANAASPEQQKAAKAAVSEFLGKQVHLTQVQFFPGQVKGSGSISANTDHGVLDLSWPSLEVSSGLLQPTSPLVGPDTPRLSDSDATEIASAFARDHFPWALAGHTTVSAAGPHDASRLVSWRSRKNGVLMPMRMDVLVGPDRKVISFTARHVPDPTLPSVHIDHRQAQALVEHKYPGNVVISAELLARTDDNNRWRPYWMLSFGPPGATSGSSQDGVVQDGIPAAATTAPTISVITVDAVTGAIRPASPDALDHD
ncbi:VanZ family protein [Streptomyces sp. NPDC005435]|uniref:VanZ family protein n=1 Tax=Streptomyces sp. NPDC005435 TaxID=3154464 RepID=UPI003451A6EE